MAKSTSVHTPNKSANKSWVELCDEVYSDSIEDEETSNFNITPERTKVQTKEGKNEIKQELDENGDNENMPTKVISEVTKTETIKEIKVEPEESPIRFSYASILKNSNSKSNISTPKTPTKTITEKVSNSGEVNPGKSVKREIQREFLHEDLSISSHLDIFHMESPLKLEPLDEAMASPAKSEKSAKKRGCPVKLMMDEDAVMPDDVLMPSPKKITRFSSRRKRESADSPLTRKRTKQSSGGYGTPRW